jgi:Yip1 domain
MVARADIARDERAWLLRAVLVLQSPRPVFAAIRDDSTETADARQEAAFAIAWLAGMSGVLATSVASRFMDNPSRDWLVLLVWAFIAGGIYAFGLYFVLGKILHVALRRLGSRGSARRARHLLAYSAAPVALALFIYWPIRIAVYGDDLFKFGGSDGGTGGDVFAWLFYAFVAWALVLLVLGVRTVHGWTWLRSLAGVGAATAVVAVLALGVSLLYSVTNDRSTRMNNQGAVSANTFSSSAGIA